MTDTVLFARLKHETNTFSSLSTGREAFASTSLFRGAEIVPEFRGTNTDLGGFLRVADAEGWDVVPTVAANATPGGVVTADAFSAFLDRILDGIEEHDPDAVLLGLHGAMVTERHRDGDGRILDAVRSAVGDDVPVMATLDLHANVSDRMVANADGLFGYDTYPHVDIGDTGETAARAMAATLQGNLEPTVVIERAPVLPPLPPLQTAAEPMASLLATAADAESEPVPDVSVLGGFAYADVPEAGVSVVGVADESVASEAAAACADLAGAADARRHEFDRTYTGVDDAVAEAAAWDRDAPLVLADIADNPGGGSAQDGTVLLEALLDAGVEDAAVAAIHDPAAVDAATAAGVGETVTVDLGGHTEENGDPIAVEGTVRLLSDGTYRNQGPMSTGLEVSFGRTAVLAVDGIDVIVASHRQQPYDPEAFRSHGITPERKRVLVLKSTVHYRAAFEPIAGGVREVSAPGLCSPDLSAFTYDHVGRPTYPLDSE
ncbi:M81 family metallopeptidase [Halobellus ruber]|uniref:M81 family metallopeptidase n=1 Tax=Halobellus ruber TaxID=2761102 RepID=A0A7J9SKD0_9EURY|nr:M81 family metallopeptidase [Halobellus ruber]MBB6646457.1 M81 family metallopeptidase [Halobellus ruber]